jgi:hypothetical protein
LATQSALTAKFHSSSALLGHIICIGSGSFAALDLQISIEERLDLFVAIPGQWRPTFVTKRAGLPPTPPSEPSTENFVSSRFSILLHCFLGKNNELSLFFIANPWCRQNNSQTIGLGLNKLSRKCGGTPELAPWKFPVLQCCLFQSFSIGGGNF